MADDRTSRPAVQTLPPAQTSTLRQQLSSAAHLLVSMALMVTLACGLAASAGPNQSAASVRLPIVDGPHVPCGGGVPVPCP